MSSTVRTMAATPSRRPLGPARRALVLWLRHIRQIGQRLLDISRVAALDGQNGEEQRSLHGVPWACLGRAFPTVAEQALRLAGQLT
jgi:hypothetical protein